MNQNYNNSPTNKIIRNSYGFSNNSQYQVRSPQNKLIPPAIFPPATKNTQYISNEIRNMQQKIQQIQNKRRIQPIQTNQTSQNYSPRPQYMINELRNQQKLSEEILRGSCSNMIKKFDTSQNYIPNLRNTTQFNPINKYSTSTVQDYKKYNEQSIKGYNFGTKSTNVIQSDNISKIIQEGTTSKSIQQSPSVGIFPIKNKHVCSQVQISKTPTKTSGIEQKNQNSHKSNKTPVKYKQANQNFLKFIQQKSSYITQQKKTQATNQQEKNSPIGQQKKSMTTVSSSLSDEKKTFKSLNEIVESKNRQKFSNQIKSSIKKSSKILNGFQLGKSLGKGKFGQVILCRHHDVGFVMALKRVQKGKVREFKMVDQFCAQIRLHSCLDHPNIVKFYGCFQDQNQICLVLQYMNGGTLFDYLNEVGALTLKQTVEYLRDIIQALVYMHDKSIAHRDIKPQNIVISSQGVAKLCDFGWSAVVQTSRKTYCGTFDYAPPQILQRKNYDTSVDIWCIGILTYELLTGRVPFEGQQRNIVMQKIVNVDKTKIQYPSDFCIQAKQFIQALIQKDPNLRPKSHQLLKFKLFNLFPSKIQKNGAKKPI